MAYLDKMNNKMKIIMDEKVKVIDERFEKRA
jgi:hypothetical protein